MQDTLPPSVKAFFPDAIPIWPKGRQPSPRLNRINQIAIVVADLDTAIEHYGAAYGWAPFYKGVGVGRTTYQGQDTHYELALAFALVDGIEIELVQPLSGKTPYHDHLAAHGEGVFHLRLSVDDIEPHLEHLGSHGITPIFGWRESHWINVNLSEKHGLRTELILSDERLHRVLQRIGRQIIPEKAAQGEANEKQEARA